MSKIFIFDFRNFKMFATSSRYPLTTNNGRSATKTTKSFGASNYEKEPCDEPPGVGAESVYDSSPAGQLQQQEFIQGHVTVREASNRRMQSAPSRSSLQRTALQVATDLGYSASHVKCILDNMRAKGLFGVHPNLDFHKFVLSGFTLLLSQVKTAELIFDATYMICLLTAILPTTTKVLDALFKAVGDPTFDDSAHAPHNEDIDSSSSYNNNHGSTNNAVAPEYRLPPPAGAQAQSPSRSHHQSPPQLLSRRHDPDIETDSAAVSQEGTTEQDEDEVDGMPTTLEQLKKGAENFKTRLTCKVCLDSTVSILFLPCRHLICCDDCAFTVKTCPMCRAYIAATIKAFVD